MKFTSRKTALSVILKKNVQRTTLNGNTPVSTRFSGNNKNQAIDLTPYMGEHNGVRISKSVRDPAGSFSLTFTDDVFYNSGTYQIGENSGDSLYGLIEPMDSIEIRMTANAFESGSAPIPMMMRGLVSRVEIIQAMGADGKPQRNIVVSGQDYGKILQMLQIFYMPGIPSSDASYVTSFPFFTQFGVGAEIKPAQDFFQDVFDNVIAPYVAAINPVNTLVPIQTDFIVLAGQVSPFGSQAFTQGTMWDLFKRYGDIGPWNEFFIEDREDAPYAVYRPNPFYDADKNFIFSVYDNEDFAPYFIDISKDSIVSISMSRTDADLANYFWVDCPRFNMNYENALKSLAVSASLADPTSTAGPYVQNYQNVDPTLYGARKMHEQTHQGGDEETDGGGGTAKGAARSANETDLIGWMNQRRIDLIAQNKDNVIFEKGTMRLRGDETIRAGTILNYIHGNMESWFYVVSVEHDYAPFGSFFTTVQFERGTNFIDRVKQGIGKDAPYFSEMIDDI